MSFAFEKLIVYQKAVAFADAVCTLTKGFPRPLLQQKAAHRASAILLSHRLLRHGKTPHHQIVV